MIIRNFLIKPASGACNMRCRYCFYEDEMASRTESKPVFMTLDTAEQLIRQALEEAKNQPGSFRQPVTFSFQGGEPTLAGLDFFRGFADLVQKYNQNQIPVQYAIQTNGLVLDEEWADFFVKNHFLVGVSIDGDKALHESLRPDASGKSTWNRVTKNLSMMQKKGVDINILCVVTRQCAKHPAKVYRSLQKLGNGYLQFIPCLDPLESPRGSMPYSLTTELYGGFLCSLFDEWYRDYQAGRYTSIRLFDDYIHLAMGLPSGTCATSGNCGAYFVVEGDGSLYPCDFYCLDEWKTGKLGEQNLRECAESDTAVRFLSEGQNHPKECGSCRFYPLCYGGCKRDWYQDTEGQNHNYFCPAFQQFFSYAGDRILQIAQRERQFRGM